MEWPGCPGIWVGTSPDLEKLYARKLWADFSYPDEGGASLNCPRHQNDYMQLFLFSRINFLKSTITITFLIPSRIDSREM